MSVHSPVEVLLTQQETYYAVQETYYAVQATEESAF